MSGEERGEEHDRGILWLVATPIGTAADLSPRAREVLESADLILAEDTRRVRALMSRFGLAAGSRLLSFNEHNEERRLPSVLERLRDGASVALVSDAGTPVLSDPGFPLVRAAMEAGARVLSVPGPSVFAAALAASGQPPLPATLAGFLPPRRAARRRALKRLAGVPWTLVVLVSPHRLRQELEDAAQVLGAGRPATLLAEISKRHERAIRGPLGELASDPEVDRPRGEYVLVVGPAPDPAPEVSAEAVGRLYREAIGEGLGRAEALRRTARRLGVSRREVYALLEGTRDRESD